MPHLTVHALEDDLRGRETELVSNLVRGLTEAVGSVFGAAGAATTQVELVATPSGRTAMGGMLVD